MTSTTVTEVMLCPIYINGDKFSCCLYLNKHLTSYLGDANLTDCRPYCAIQYLPIYNYVGGRGGKFFLESCRMTQHDCLLGGSENE